MRVSTIVKRFKDISSERFATGPVWCGVYSEYTGRIRRISLLGASIITYIAVIPRGVNDAAAHWGDWRRHSAPTGGLPVAALIFGIPPIIAFFYVPGHVSVAFHTSQETESGEWSKHLEERPGLAFGLDLTVAITNALARQDVSTTYLLLLWSSQCCWKWSRTRRLPAANEAVNHADASF